MRIEVWADIVCPWCYIGKRKLERAIAAAGIADVEIVPRAFQLDPRAPAESEPTIDHLAKKLRMAPPQVASMMARVTSVAREVDLEYHLERTRSGNTRPAHRLLKRAAKSGDPRQAWEHLYRAYFTEGRSLFDDAALAQLADELAIPAADREAEVDAEIDTDLEKARELGITGVPFFVANGRVAVSGAQPEEVMIQMLRRASA